MNCARRLPEPCGHSETQHESPPPGSPLEARPGRCKLCSCKGCIYGFTEEELKSDSQSVEISVEKPSRHDEPTVDFKNMEDPES